MRDAASYIAFRKWAMKSATNLVHILVLRGIVIATTVSDTLPPDTSGTALAEGRGECEVDVLLAVDTNEERGHVDNTPADADVTLTDEDSGVMDRLGKTSLEHLRLQTAVEELLDRETKDEVELLLLLGDEAHAGQSAQQGRTLKQALRVLLLEGKKVTGSLTDLGNRQLHTPDLALVAESCARR